MQHFLKYIFPYNKKPATRAGYKERIMVFR